MTDKLTKAEADAIFRDIFERFNNFRTNFKAGDYEVFTDGDTIERIIFKGEEIYEDYSHSWEPFSAFVDFLDHLKQRTGE